MKIALINEFSQASKNDIILQQLKSVVEPKGHKVYNTGMVYLNNPNDLPEDYTKDNPRLTYIHIAIQAALLLNSKAVDFVVTGCGTAQGAIMACNMFPGVCCGYCIEPTDAYLFLQINNGNTLAIPYAKGFGWGAELNLKNIFESAFSCSGGNGYPANRKEAQNKNVKLLYDIKQKTSKPLIEALKQLDQEFVKMALTSRFMDCFLQGCEDKELLEYVKRIKC